MEPITCFVCKKENVPFEDAHEINKAHYCTECVEKETQTEPTTEVGPDDTLNESVCAFCNTEHEGKILPKHSVYPICDNCKTDLDKSIFPLWVKLFFAGVLALVIFSIFWNWRFFSAYNDIKKSNSYYTSADVAKAAGYMQHAAENVPESKDVVAMASYFTALKLLQEDKSAAALVELEKCKDLPEESFHINQLTLQAEMGVGYDTRDYNLFLKAAKDNLQLDTTQSYAWASVASAYACLYAQKGADSLKTLALRNLKTAKSIDSVSAEYKEYSGRILYRLNTKNIINKQEYDKLYPNGYTSNF